MPATAAAAAHGMSFEMSLPHAPRIQAIGLDGSETLAQDEQQWDLYYTVQRALAAQQEGGGGEEADGDTSGTKKEQAAAGKAAQPSDPQKVLQKLLSARGELDVISDLVTFVEQQQFLAVAGIQRHPPPLEERVRTRCLRLAGAKQQLRRAAERLAGGAAALRAQEVVETRFLADLANLRRLWRLRRHAGEGGMFYADLSLPLRGAAGEGISQEGAQCNIVQVCTLGWAACLLWLGSLLGPSCLLTTNIGSGLGWCRSEQGGLQRGLLRAFPTT